VCVCARRGWGWGCSCPSVDGRLGLGLGLQLPQRGWPAGAGSGAARSRVSAGPAGPAPVVLLAGSGQCCRLRLLVGQLPPGSLLPLLRVEVGLGPGTSRQRAPARLATQVVDHVGLAPDVVCRPQRVEYELWQAGGVAGSGLLDDPCIELAAGKLARRV
jgi:hypothetical protein